MIKSKFFFVFGYINNEVEEMTKKYKSIIMIFIMLIFILSLQGVSGDSSFAHADVSALEQTFPMQDSAYEDAAYDHVLDILKHRIQVEPFNLVTLIIFLCAIVHTLLSSVFIKKSHKKTVEYKALIKAGLVDKHSHSISAGVYHLLGEVEVVFGIWAVVLAVSISLNYSWTTFVAFIDSLHYTEPLFVIVIMTIASSRPIIKFFEQFTWQIVKVLGDSAEVWWLTILILTPLLGSFITEPAAMTIAAYMLSEKFYQLNPPMRLRYVTLALLFVNVSIGGALTNFAAPPILMVAGPWDWTTQYMFLTFGWKSVLAIVISTGTYYFIFKKDIKALGEAYQHYLFKRKIQSRFVSAKELEESFTQLANIVNSTVGFIDELNAYSSILKDNLNELALQRLTQEEVEELDIRNAIDSKFESIQIEEMRKILPGLLPEDQRPQYRDPNWNTRGDKVPMWITVVHLVFLVWTVVNAHNPVLFMAGFMFFLGFFQVTAFYQNRIDLKPALLVAFFIAGIMIHGSLQSWWIGPLLTHLPAEGLNSASILLTAFNDNAAITYLSTLVSELPKALKYAIVSGAITGGGLTVIANAPNPVGQSILKKHFNTGISSVSLFRYAALPTLITAFIFYFLR